jgi:hypothetical protein
LNPVNNKAMKLEAGKYYRARNGNVYGPLQSKESSERYKFSISHIHWTSEGGYHPDNWESDYDLIEEILITSVPPKEPTFRPYTLEEAGVWLLGAQVKGKTDEEFYYRIVDKIDNYGQFSPEKWFEKYTFLDGTPCGMPE